MEQTLNNQNSLLNSGKRVKTHKQPTDLASLKPQVGKEQRSSFREKEGFDKLTLNKIGSAEGALQFRELMEDDIFDPQNSSVVQNNVLIMYLKQKESSNIDVYRQNQNHDLSSSGFENNQNLQQLKQNKPNLLFQKAVLGLSNRKIFLLNNIIQMEPLKVLDIEFLTFEEKLIQIPHIFLNNSGMTSAIEQNKSSNKIRSDDNPRDQSNKSQIQDQQEQPSIVKNGFQLGKKQELLIFVPMPQQLASSTNEQDINIQQIELINQWKTALKTYVIQKEIFQSYKFSEILGEGSFGKVFLGHSLHHQPHQVLNTRNSLRVAAGTIDERNQDLTRELSTNQLNGIQQPQIQTSILQQSNDQKPEVAIKILDKCKIAKNDLRTKQLVTEIRVHWELEKCDGALRLLELFEDDVYIYIVLEYQSMGSLLNQIMKKTKFTEQETKIIMSQLLLAVDFIHQKKLIHRDLKLDNVLIQEVHDQKNYNVKIADFGLAVYTPFCIRQKLYEKCGTPCYVAPEILRDQGYTQKCDIFSMGSLFFNLVTGRYLFNGINKEQILARNRQCDLSMIPEYLQEVSEPCRELIMWMLEADPGQRPSAKEALLHSWFKKDSQIIKELLQVNDDVCRSEQNNMILNFIGDMNINQNGGFQANASNYSPNSFNSFQMVSCYFRRRSSNNLQNRGLFQFNNNTTSTKFKKNQPSMTYNRLQSSKTPQQQIYYTNRSNSPLYQGEDVLPRHTSSNQTGQASRAQYFNALKESQSYGSRNHKPKLQLRVDTFYLESVGSKQQSIEHDLTPGFRSQFPKSKFNRRNKPDEQQRQRKINGGFASIDESMQNSVDKEIFFEEKPSMVNGISFKKPIIDAQIYEEGEREYDSYFKKSHKNDNLDDKIDLSQNISLCAASVAANLKGEQGDHKKTVTGQLDNQRVNSRRIQKVHPKIQELYEQEVSNLVEEMRNQNRQILSNMTFQKKNNEDSGFTFKQESNEVPLDSFNLQLLNNNNNSHNSNPKMSNGNTKIYQTKRMPNNMLMSAKNEPLQKGAFRLFK